MSPTLTIVLVTLTGMLVFGCIRPAMLCLVAAAKLEELLHGGNTPPGRQQD
jgi:hypothetical protein